VALSEDFLTAVQDMALKLSTHAPQARKVPMLLTAVAMAMEVYMKDCQNPLYCRGFAWIKLVCLLTAMRSDDIQGMLPDTMIMQQRGSEAVLDRTKVSGPGKKVRWRNVYVSRTRTRMV